ncbi:MAG TPA: EscU/YscU/HrcU family type III secretion system export apparatus switch protein [Bryobacteraceae bacterium]|jgi:flagellar biosynthetic protein FlhB|nr:EscU/YscU/HrcU family type III secretion system export apparatus switch protein [Bryobacteraceae bacterium]
MADHSGKTEEPTQRRLEKARREGQFAAARELVSAAQFAVFLALAGAGGAAWLAGLEQSLRRLFLLGFAGPLSPADLTHVAWALFWRHGLSLVAAGLGVAAVTLGFRLVTTGFGLSWKKLAPDPGRLNPLGRLRDLPRQNLTTLAEAAVLLPVFLWAVYRAASERLPALLALPLGSVESGYRFVTASLADLFWKAAGLFLLFGAADFYRQQRRHRQDLRMSKQEVKEEVKEQEGNPQMKAKVRRLQRERARRHMMKEVPQATAVVVNPTHYAVAIRYRMEDMAAPQVVAKGKNYLARRIREIATAHQVPIVENPPLAQALYKSVEVGQEIPPHLYRAVAEILAYIFKLMNGRRPGA